MLGTGCRVEDAGYRVLGTGFGYKGVGYMFLSTYLWLYIKGLYQGEFIFFYTCTVRYVDKENGFVTVLPCIIVANAIKRLKLHKVELAIHIDIIHIQRGTNW